MMRISTRGRYALRAMVDLAQHVGSEPILRQEIAERQEISADYVAQLFRHLQSAGLVEGVKGPGGGYRLARDPSRITAADVIQAVEGPVAVVYCVLPGAGGELACNRADRCVTHLLWRQISEAVTNLLASVTLQDLADQARQLFPGEEWAWTRHAPHASSANHWETNADHGQAGAFEEETAVATHDNQVLVRQFFGECWNQGAVEKLTKLLRPDHVHHLPGWDLHGPQQVGELITDLRTAFPDLHFTIDDEIVGQDKVVIRWTAHGTHLGDFFGLPPTGNPVEYTGIDIIRCSNGRIVELWGQPDSAGLNRQLRAI